MAAFSSYIVPAILCAVLVYGLVKRVDVFGCFVEGAREGITVSLRILPALVALMTAIGMFKASGALDVFTHFLAPAAQLLSIPREVLPLAILRPISGSGALAVLRDILATHGPDSTIGRIAAVMQGSTETTFYTIAVYYGATKVRKLRHTLPSALAGDLMGFVMSAVIVRVLFFVA